MGHPESPFRFRELDSSALAAALFARKFGHPPPTYPYHIAACLPSADGSEAIACYVHFSSRGDVLLGGGACVDNRLLRQLDADQRGQLRVAGGLYRQTLEFAQRHFGTRYAAIFGYCGDRTAEAVDRAAGFVSTPHEHLLVYWTDAGIGVGRRTKLIARAHAEGPF